MERVRAIADVSSSTHFFLAGKKSSLPASFPSTARFPFTLMNPARFPLRRNPKGFTLIELLTVIAIIGILAAILIPVTGVVREKAKISKCTSNLRQIAVAMQLYANDHKGKFPATYVTTPATEGAWSNALTAQGYLPLTNTVFQCPSDPYSPDVPRPRSYVYCVPAMANSAGQTAIITSYQQEFSKVSNPARTFMITEWHWNQQDVRSLNGSYAAIDIVYPPKAESSVGHKGGTRNFVYMDGHVAFLQLAQSQRTGAGWNP